MSLPKFSPSDAKSTASDKSPSNDKLCKEAINPFFNIITALTEYKEYLITTIANITKHLPEDEKIRIDPKQNIDFDLLVREVDGLGTKADKNLIPIMIKLTIISTLLEMLKNAFLTGEVTKQIKNQLTEALDKTPYHFAYEKLGLAFSNLFDDKQRVRDLLKAPLSQPRFTLSWTKQPSKEENLMLAIDLDIMNIELAESANKTPK